MCSREGWVKSYRKMLDWEWYTDSHMVHLFLHLVLNANVNDKTWRGVNIKRGQLVTSLITLNAQTGISIQTLRTCLNRLVESGEITQKSTNKYRIITICKYDSYQSSDDDTNKQLTNNQQTNQQTTNKPSNNNIRRKEYNNTLSSLRSDKVPKTDVSASSDVNGKRKAKKKSQDEYSLGYKCRLVFEEYFKDTYGEEYYYTAKDAKAMQGLVKKIAFSRKSRGQPVDDSSVVEALCMFLRSINKAWISDNFTVAIINSQYNSIIAEIKNTRHHENNRTSNQQGAEQRYADAAGIITRLLDDDGSADEEAERERAEVLKEFQP